ncbi:MAG: PspC domain-containing protein [Candidatus Latescibacterota bacterium]
MGETYGLDPTLVRLGMFFLGIATGGVPLLFTYIVGWIIIPKATGAEEPR